MTVTLTVMTLTLHQDDRQWKYWKIITPDGEINIFLHCHRNESNFAVYL